MKIDNLRLITEAPRLVRYGVEMGLIKFPPPNPAADERLKRELAKEAIYEQRRKAKRARKTGS